MSNVIAAFSEEHVQRLTGVTKYQLRYWDRIGFFSPTYLGEDWDSSVGRIYSYRDVVSLRVLNRLRNVSGVSLHHLRDIRRFLSENPEETWTGVRLYVFDKRVAWVEPGTEKPQEILSGQYFVSEVALDDVVSDVNRDIKLLNQRDERHVGRIEKLRTVNHSQAVIAGTRVRARDIRSFHEAGYSVAQILEEYPDLSERDILAAIEYGDNRAAA